MKTSKRLRKSSTASFTRSTGEGQEFRNRSGDRGCNPDTAPHAQSGSRLSQLKPNSSRTLGTPLPATLFSPNRKAGGTRGQDLRARESWEQRKGSYSPQVNYFGRCWPGHRQQASQSVSKELMPENHMNSLPVAAHPIQGSLINSHLASPPSHTPLHFPQDLWSFTCTEAPLLRSSTRMAAFAISIPCSQF